MQRRIEWGIALFSVTALIMVAAGLVMVVKGNRTGGFLSLALGAFWFFYAMRARKRSKNAKTDDESQGPAD